MTKVRTMRRRSFERVLVATKSSYLGDTIIATPFLAQLRAALPDARIDLLTGPQQVEILTGCPDVDSFIPLPQRDRKRLAPMWRLIRGLRATRYQAAFLLNRSGRSALTAIAAGVPERIGLSAEGRGPLLTTRVRWNRRQPEIECHLDLLRAVGLPATYALPRLWVTAAERDEAVRWLPPGDGPLVVMHPSCAHDRRRRNWPAERYVALGDHLVADRGARLLLAGSAEERDDCAAVAAAIRQPVTVLAGQTDFRQTMAVIAHAALWVGNDGGMLHTAVAVGTPTVGIFGPTMAQRWGYHDERHRTLVHGAPCRRASGNAIRASLDAVSLDEVRAAVEEVWPAAVSD